MVICGTWQPKLPWFACTISFLIKNNKNDWWISIYCFIEVESNNIWMSYLNGSNQQYLNQVGELYNHLRMFLARADNDQTGYHYVETLSKTFLLNKYQIHT